MVAFAEVDSDIFQLNKIGLTPQTEINLVFDSTQFACDMAPKCGMFKEYAIREHEVICEVPPPEQLSGDFEALHAEPYDCGTLNGLFRCVLSGYEPDGPERTVVCDPYEHTNFTIEFPANADLYRSLRYRIESDDYLETLIYLTFKVTKTQARDGFKYILKGKVHGSVLFFDTDQLGKYAEAVHPYVGDIVAIDFPDENNREKYEITECYDKQLTQDGINPLLHKYVWKCKARRYVNSHEPEAPGLGEDDKRLAEKTEYEMAVDEIVSKEVSTYDTIDAEGKISEDAAYGGYEADAKQIPSYDKQDVRNNDVVRHEFLDDGTALDIMRFGCGSRLVTDGYTLTFVGDDGLAAEITISESAKLGPGVEFESGLRWLKATDASVVFVNIEGESCVVVQDEYVTDPKLEVNVNSLYEQTLDTSKAMNANGQNFLKFKGTRSYLWADGQHLYAKLGSDGRLRRLV